MGANVVDARCARYRPPFTTGGYVDCQSVGHVVSVSDALGDSATRLPAGAELVRTRAPWIDLMDLRVAVTATQFCVDFTTAAIFSVLAVYTRGGNPRASVLDGAPDRTRWATYP